ncbi:MAG: hypothetical protein RIQ89_327 [Bacteroidota bacterium]|jgi:hypothetical protein
MKKSFLTMIAVLHLAVLFTPQDSHAQCAMCRSVAESNVKNKQNKVGTGLNNGILYLMAVPYAMGAVAAYYLYKNKDKFLKP